MTKFSEIKGFAFDLDGVITDTAKFHTQAWHALADQVNVTWTPELQESLKGIDRMGSLEMILKAGNKQDDYTHDEKVALASWKNNHYVELISGLTPDDILPGMADFIKELNDKGYKASVASASKNAPFILDGIIYCNYSATVSCSLAGHITTWGVRNWGSGNDYYVYCRNWGNGLGTARRCVTRFRLGRLFTLARLDISTKHWCFDLP